MDEAYDFGMILKQLRTQRGFTQEQLAKKIHKESSVISRYENNLQSPTFETVRAFSLIFNVSMNYLSGFKDDFGVPMSGLSEEQSELIKDLAAQFSNKDSSFSSNPDKKYAVIGRIVTELLKG